MKQKVTDYQTVRNYFNEEFKIPKNWSYELYNDVIKEVKSPIEFNDEENYELITAKRRNGGLVSRGFLKGSEIKTKNLFSVDIGDFIMAKMQIIHGASGLVTPELKNAKVSGSYLRFKPKNDYNLEYLNWFSHSPFFYQQTFISSVGSNLEKMNFDKKHWLSHHRIPLPTPKERMKITFILDHVQELIENTNLIIEKNLKLKTGLLRKLFENGDNANKKEKTTVGLIPSHWKLSTIGKKCKVGTGKTPSRVHPENFEGNVNWVKSAEVKYNVITKTEEKITKEALGKSKIYPKQTILFAMYGQGVTRARCALLGVEASVNQAIAAIKTGPELRHLFLFYWLQRQYAYHRTISQGTHQSNFNLDLVRDIVIPVPPCLDEQDYVSSVLWDIDQVLEFESHYLEKLLRLKIGIIRQLLFGKLVVPT